MREVYEMVESQQIYVVPNFISEGYFCQQVLPRELQLTGPTSIVSSKIVHYCDPVGIHPNMTRLLLQRADEVAAGVPRAETSLIIVGHGTNLNDNSTKAITDQVQLIREGGYGFAEVVDAYMEEAPFIAEWDKLTTAPNVVVVPFFIADGLHSYQDIPVLLGMETEPTAAASERDIFRHNPYELRGRRLYYSSAIGTERLMADIVLDQVAEFDNKYTPTSAAANHQETLEHWLKEQILAHHAQLQIGQVQVCQNAAGHYRLTHLQDANNADLETYTDPEAARSIANVDHTGAFRALKSAPTLKGGWALELPDLANVIRALNYFYPAAVGLAMQQAKEKLHAVPLRQTLGRQTGMYKFTNTIRDDQAGPMVSRVCADQNCMRRILWDLTVDQPLAAPEKRNKSCATGTLPLLCIEACTHIVGEARKLAKKNFEEAQAKT